MATHTIGTGGSFSTVQSWWDDIPATLTEQRIGQVKNQELTSASAILTTGARVTTSSFNIILEAVAGGSFLDNANVRTNALRYNSANGAGLRATATRCIDISGQVNDLTVRNLQLKCDSTVSGYDSVLGFTGTAGTNQKFHHLICEGFTSASGWAIIAVAVGSDPSVFSNILVIQRSTGGNGISTDTTSSTQFIACTVVRPSNITAAGIGISMPYVGTPIKDVVICGFSQDKGGSGDTTASDYNATTFSSAASGLKKQTPDHNVYSVAYTTATFVQPSDAGGNHDFRLAAGSALQGVGVYDGTVAPTDISGTTRANPPAIGAWEIVSGGSSFTGSESETLAAADATTGVLVDVGTISEAGAAVDAVTGVLVDGGTIVETVASADVVSGQLVDPASVIETLASSDSVGATVIPAGSAVETLVAADVVSSPSALLGGSIVEGSALVDAVDATGGTQTIITVDQPSTAPGLGGGGDPGRKKKRARPSGKRRYLNQDGTITDRPGQADIAGISPPSNVVPFKRVEKEQEPDVIYADLDADEMEAVMQLVVNG